MSQKYHILTIAAIAVGLILLFLALLLFGSVPLSLNQLLNGLTNSTESIERSIILELRLPYAVTAALTGIMLGLGGLVMQSLLRNPLAEPYILGLSSGASLGIVLLNLGMFAGALSMQVPVSSVVAAFAGSMVILVIVLSLANKAQDTTLLIFGLMVSYFTYSVVSLLVFFNSPEALRRYFVWSMGSYANTTWIEVLILTVTAIIGVIYILSRAKALDVLSMGSHYAASVGYAPKRERWLLLLTVALMASVCTAYCGPIAFLGIAAPYLAKTLFRTSSHRIIIPAVILTGSFLSLLAGLIAKAPWSAATLPFNGVAALFGAPIVAFMLLARNRRIL